LNYKYKKGGLLFMEMNFASNGKANAALTTGVIGLSLAALNTGLFNGGLFGGGNCCSDNTAVNRYELNTQKDLIAKDAEIAYLKGRDAAKTDSLELYQYIDGRFRGVEAQIAQQAVVNAQISANLACQQTAIATLQGLTKTVIPITSVCPAPMPEFNSWTAPTTTAA
jgi:hypothetical protein